MSSLGGDHRCSVGGDVLSEAGVTEVPVHVPVLVESETAAGSAQAAADLLGGARQLEGEGCGLCTGDRLEVDPQTRRLCSIEDGRDEHVDLTAAGEPDCEGVLVTRAIVRRGRATGCQTVEGEFVHGGFDAPAGQAADDFAVCGDGHHRAGGSRCR